MANYYTYGVVPTVEETVFGPLSAGYANGGEVDDERENTMPTGEDEPVSPLDQAAPSNNQPYVPDWAKNIIAFGAAPRLIPDLTTAGTGGKKSATQEMFAKRQSEIAEKDKAIRDRLSSIGRLTPETEQELDKSLSYNLNKLAEEEKEYVSTLPQRDTLSGLLQEGKFKEAYKFAEDNGLQKLITDPSQLKNLRDPFTKEEGKAFINAMPSNFLQKAFNIDDDSFKKGYEFDPQGAEGRGAFAWVTPGKEGPVQSETGFPDLGRVLQHKEIQKEMTPFDKLIRAVVYAGMAFAGASALGLTGGLTGAGAAGAGTAGAGAGAGTSGALSGLKSAYQAVASIPTTIGRTVAQALGLPIEKAIAQTAFGNSLISGATTAAKGGDIGDIIKSGLMAAGVTYGLDAAVNAVKGMMPDISKAVGSEVSNAAATSGVSPTSALDALQEVVITAKKVSDVAGLAGAATGAVTPSPEKAPLEEAAKPEDLEEVTVTGKRIPTAPVVTPVPSPEPSPIEAAQPEPEFEPAPTVDDLQEIEVTGKRIETPPIVTPAPTPVESPIDTAQPEPEFEPAPTVDDLQEIEVTGKRIETPPVVVSTSSPIETSFEPAPTVDDLQEIEVTGKRIETPPVVVPPPSPLDALEEVVVTGKRTEPYVPEPPPIVINPADIAKDYKPTEVKEESTLKKILDEYGTVENFLKLLGALGSMGGTKVGVTTGTAPPPPSLGGALPKYTLTREQLRPDIDYYTYGTRPEAKFFEDKLQLEKPVQPPATTPTPEPEEEPKAAGGLAGYANGGSNSSRYVAGPGSGREDKIPALLSDGEYVIDAETLALLGDGSTKEGARRMDSFRANIRKHKGRALSRGRISPNAKSPDKYMGGGLT